VACANEGTWAFTPYYVPWLEEDSGLDVTPCFDADGTWNPGPDCGNVPLNPEASTGTWQQMCHQTETLTGPLSSCGKPFIPPSTGGAAGAGGMGGSAGTSGGGAAGAGGVSGNAGTGGDAGGGQGGFGGGGGPSLAGGSAGAVSGSSAGTAPVGVQTTSASDASGDCSCRVPARHGGSGGAAALLGLALIRLGRRRQQAAKRR
jgi:MYXO-CTERM domain-containing protein